MPLSWSEHAISDLGILRAFIANERPGAAGRTVLQIFTQLELIKEQPHLGRPGRVLGTRELLIPATPFIVPYRVTNGTIEIIRVFHAAQRWPDEL